MDVQKLKGVGEASAKLLSKLGLESASDLIENIPRRYDDYSKVTAVRNIRPGTVTIRVRFSAVRARYSKKGLHMTEALASDDTGSVKVIWFNQPYRIKSTKSGEEYFLSGEYAANYRYLAITNPACELVSAFPLHTARLVPQYKLVKGITSSQLRRFTSVAFKTQKIPETLPVWLIKEYSLIAKKDALYNMHFPSSLKELESAKRRLAFEELFEMSLASALNKLAFAQDKAAHVPFNESLVKRFVQSLPFKLTDDQRKVAWTVLQDMTSGHPMNRLVEGDVGSGKTVVAAIAMVNVAASGGQAALMAPTELLASQHAATLMKLLPDELASRVILLSGSMTKAQKEKAYIAIKSGQAQTIVGTHALIQGDVVFQNLQLAIIDEQHRFGVEQRKKLQGKAQVMPHILNLTATPIPRSLVLTLYGEMDISVIAQTPAGRKKKVSKIVQPEQRPQLYESLHEIIKQGRQVFVVCPQIEETELQTRPSRSLGVISLHKQISGWLKGTRVGLLHGKMKPQDKEDVMQDFINKNYDVLVSTTVIEVGVNVPNASIMIIEGADRFGLAQLHQLRGRIGRGEHSGYFYMVLSDNTGVSRRLRYLEHESDGFKLAEYDLELRGPGAIYGTFQHGALDLRVANITDTKLVAKAREASATFIEKEENLLQYPQLKARVNILRRVNNLN